MSQKLIQSLRKIKYNPYSQTGNKFNRIFKDNCIESFVNHCDYVQRMHKKWSRENDINSNKVSTNEKLNQLINKSKRAIRYKEFLYKTFNQESLLTNILINKSREFSERNKHLEKNKNDQEENNNEGVTQNIQKMINKRNKFQINKLFLTRKHEENNRNPPVCLYTPKYDYITKHSPCVNIEKQSKKNLEIDSNEIRKRKINDNSFSLTPIYENKKRRQTFLSSFSSENSKIILSLIRNKSQIKSRNYEYYIEENEDRNVNLIIKNKDFFLSQQGNKEINKNNKINKNNFELSPLFPKLVEKKIPVPNFAKMLSRNKTMKSTQRGISDANYSPNYNAIFLDVVDNRPVDYELRKKKYNLKKILGDFNPTKDYILFPILNINNDNVNENK